MLYFKADHDHLAYVMCKMDNFREDSSFCNISLMIDNQRLQAHRCVLAAGSPYFNSLLNGQFTEAKMKEVNLSKVTTNFTALERVVKFIYTGEIDIDEDNLEVTIKLSSFFLIESLRTICCSIMTDNLSLATCLRYYFYSKEHGIITMEKNTWPMVRSRFHDYLIYEDTTQDISTDEMEHLVERNVLQHCSNVSIFRFIALWVNKGLTEGHVLIANEVIENVMQRDISPEICLLHLANELSEDSLYKMIESSLRAETTCIDIKSKDMLLHSLKQLLEKLSIENEVHIFEMSSQLHADGKETAIITVCSSQGTIECTERLEINESHDPDTTFSTSTPMLYVCAYVPRTKCWYRIKTIHYKWNNMHDFNNFDAVIHQNHCLFRFYILHNEIVISEPNNERILVNSLTYLESGQDELCIDYSFLRPHYFCLAAGRSNSRYAIVKHYRNDYFDRRSYYLVCYKVHNDGKTWQEQFRTKVFDLAEGDGFYDLNAKISTVSNEMLVVCSTQNDDVIVFVIDLNEDNSNLVTPLATDKLNNATHLNILEANDAMYIVTGGTTRCSTDTKKARVSYEYKLRSKQPEKINSTVACLEEIDRNRVDLFPCLSQASTSVGDGLWYMEGNDDQASSLTKVSVDKDRNPVLEHHTPPPFPIVTAIVAGRISCQILENKTPVTRFFGNE